MLVLSGAQGADSFGNCCKQNSFPFWLRFEAIITTRSLFCCSDTMRSRGTAGSPTHMEKPEAQRTHRAFRRSHAYGN